MGAEARVRRSSVTATRGRFVADALAGVPGASGSVPDGMAASVLAGVNPIHGLYASAVGPIAGGVTAGTELMVITTTSAAALAAGSALTSLPAADRPSSLFLLTIVAGGLMGLAGVLRLARLTRFVSHSVMMGFLTGVAFNIVFGQLADLTGVDASGSYAISRAAYVVLHPSEIVLESLLVGLVAIAILVSLARTGLRMLSALVALAIPTLAVALFAWDQVATVSDVGAIPSGLPVPELPDLSAISFEIVVGAIAVAAIVLVQGAGVRESLPGRGASDPNRDFVAQGVANLASGLFRGQPVGGSVGQSALNRSAGARSRWASVFSGIWMILILVLFSGLVGRVPMPTLAGVLIVAAVGSLRPAEIATILGTGRTAQIALVTTFVATLILPVAAAVGVGVALSLLLQLNREALDLVVVELVPRPDGSLEEHPAPTRLESERVVVLDAYGSLLYAGARTLLARLPDPSGTRAPVVVLRVRGRTALGATFFAVVSDYAARLGAVGGRLFLSGVGPDLLARMQGVGVLDGPQTIRAFEATPVIGASSRRAYDEAGTWLIAHRAEPRDEQGATR